MNKVLKVVNMHGVVIGSTSKASEAADMLWLDAQSWDDSIRPTIVDIGDFKAELVFSDRRLFAQAQPHLHVKK